VTLTSATPGTTVIDATTTVTVGGVSLTRSTGDGLTGDSADAQKTWVDANIQITPATDTDPISDTHTLTVHVNVNPGTGFVNAPAGTSITVTKVSGPGTIAGSPCLTVAATGSCTVTLTSATVGTTVIQASTTVSVGGVSLTRTTGDGLAGDSANAQKIWVNSSVTTQVHNPSHTDVTNGAVAVGTIVHDSATVDVGAGLTVPAGSTFTFHRYSNLACTGASVDQTGVAVTAGAQTGTAESSGFTTTVGQFGYIAEFVSGNTALAANATGVCEPFSAVDANIQITPATDTDPVGDTHTLTVHVNVNPGTGFVNAPAGTSVTVTKVSGPGTITGSPCLTVTTTGTCTVTLTSATTGVTVIDATTTVTVGGVSLTRSTGDGLTGDSADAQKTWVNARISIQQSGTNPINSPHTFVVTVQKDLGDGAGFVAAAGVTVTSSLTGVGGITGGTCGPSGPTNGSGQCTVIVNSAVAGQATVNASAAVSIGVATINVATNGNGAFNISNVKTWFDTHVRIVKTINGGTPTGTDPTFTFQLWSGLSASTAGTLLETKTTTTANNVLNFATGLTPGATYQMCELLVAGYTPVFGAPGFGSFNPGGNNPGYLCFNFTANASADLLTITVDNLHQTGPTLTIGYWKNWASCSASKGKQDPTLDQVLQLMEPTGLVVGDLVLHDTNANPNVASDCAQVVNLLNKTAITGGKKLASDPLFNMAAQYVAYLLNVQNGATACTALGDAAQALLAAHDFNGLTHTALTAEQAAYANALNELLDTYNNNNGCGAPPTPPNPL
jgi:hypothetical protein